MTLLDLVSLEPTATIMGAPAHHCELLLTRDGRHVIVSDEDARNARVRVHDLAEPVRPPMEIPEAEYLVDGDTEDAHWYAGSVVNNAQQLWPIGPSGVQLTQGMITVDTGGERVFAVSKERGYAVVSRGRIPWNEEFGAIDLLDTRSGLPFATLYSAKARYESTRDELPHLRVRMGVAAPFAELDALLADPSSRAPDERRRILLWTAALAAKLRERHDAVWFSLLTALRPGGDRADGYLVLAGLASILVQTNTAENLLGVGDPAAALTCSRDALKTLRGQGDAAPPPAIDLYAPTLGSLVPNYRAVVERELWLLMATSFAALGRAPEAELALREVLRHEPDEWRAYQGLLQLALQDEDAAFLPLLGEAQAALRLHAWTNSPGFTLPERFFNPQAIEARRTAIDRRKRTAPGAPTEAPLAPRG